MTNCLGRQKREKNREERGRQILWCVEIVVHKTPRMGAECGKSLLLGKGDGETCLVVGITGVPEIEESGRGADKDFVDDGVGGCTTLHVAYRIHELLQFHCVKPFSECLQDLCNAYEDFSRYDVILAIFLQTFYFDKLHIRYNLF